MMAEFVSRQRAKQLGLPRYFSGKVCRMGHVAEHFTGAGQCCECRKSYLRERRWKRKLFVRGVIEQANSHSWIVRCGGRTAFNVQIGDVENQQVNLPLMVVGAIVEFDLWEGELPQNLEVVQ